MIKHFAFTVFAAALVAGPAIAHVHVPGLDENGQCVGDADSDAAVVINELVLAVNNALGGCPALPVEIQFKGVVGNQDFACGTAYQGIGTGNSQFFPTDFRLYVSNVRLVTVSGDEVPVTLEQDDWQYQNVAMLDFENGSGSCANGNEATNTSVRGSVPAGVYTGVKFVLGLPFELNHGNVSTAPLPLNYSAMFWSWQFGYKFLRVDTADDKFRVHLGSTGCDGSSPSRPPNTCTHPNLAEVSLSNFNPQHGVILADLKALLAANNIDVNDPETPPGCMSDPDDTDCMPLFGTLGINPATGLPASGQTFFRLAEEGDEAGHVEFKVASDTDGGGKLVAHPEFDTNEAIPLFFAACLGGTGDECDGGTRLFSAVNPGIEPIEAPEPDESLFSVVDAVPVSLEVTALSDGLTIRLGDATLDSVGDTLLLGSTPAFHADLLTQLALPGGGEPSGTFSASLKLTTTTAPYQASDVFTIKFTPKDTAHD